MWKQPALETCQLALFQSSVSSAYPLMFTPSIVFFFFSASIYVFIWLYFNSTIQNYLLCKMSTGCSKLESEKQEPRFSSPQTPLPLSRVWEGILPKFAFCILYTNICTNENSLGFVYIFIQMSSYNAYCFATHYCCLTSLESVPHGRLCTAAPSACVCLGLRVAWHCWWAVRLLCIC